MQFFYQMQQETKILGKTYTINNETMLDSWFLAEDMCVVACAPLYAVSLFVL